MKPEDLPISLKIATAGIAGCTADVASYPLDTVKVWQQITGEKSTTAKPNVTNGSNMKLKTSAGKVSPITLSKKGKIPIQQASRNVAVTSLNLPLNYAHAISKPKPNNGIMATMLKVVRAHGVKGLYSGLPAGLQRQLGFCSVRIGLYDSIKNYYINLVPAKKDSKLIMHSVLAGCTTGLVAVAIFQPTEVVKIRMQASGGTGTFSTYRSLFKGGLLNGWKGYETNCARMMVVNVCEIVTYDLVKSTLVRNRILNDSLPCHMTSGLISGFITTVIASPIDVVKTRYMNSKAGVYSSPIHCAIKTLKTEGAKAFYKGFLPSYLRIGSWNVLMFVCYEQYKRLCCSTCSRLSADLPIHKEHHHYYEHAFFQSLLECGPIS